MPLRKFLLSVLVFPLATGGLLAANKDFPDLEYVETGGKKLLLDLFVPEGVSNPPLVIYIHGGAWTQGSRKELPFKWLTGEGFALASISYRFSQEATFPAQLLDCKAAVRWLREHASEYGYDASRIGVVGQSAGGHLAVLLGATNGNAELGDAEGSERSAVQAVVDFYGPADFILRAKTQPELTDKPGSRVYNLLGGAPGDNEALAKLASGAWQMSAGDAPLLIFHGEADTTVLPGQSRRLLDAARSAGVEATLHTVPGAAHEIEPFLTDEYKRLVVEFLNRHLRKR